MAASLPALALLCVAAILSPTAVSAVGSGEGLLGVRSAVNRADVRYMESQLQKVGEAGRTWAKTMTETVEASHDTDGNAMLHVMEDHRAIVEETFAPAALRRLADEHIALLEETSGSAALDLSEHGRVALEDLASLGQDHHKAAERHGWHHMALLRHHQQFNRHHGASPLALVEVIDVLKKEGVEAAHQLYHRRVDVDASRGIKKIIARMKRALQLFSRGFMRLLASLKRVLAHLLWIMIRVVSSMFVGVGGRADLGPVSFGGGPVLQVCFGATELVLGEAGKDQAKWHKKVAMFEAAFEREAKDTGIAIGAETDKVRKDRQARWAKLYGVAPAVMHQDGDHKNKRRRRLLGGEPAEDEDGAPTKAEKKLGGKVDDVPVADEKRYVVRLGVWWCVVLGWARSSRVRGMRGGAQLLFAPHSSRFLRTVHLLLRMVLLQPRFSLPSLLLCFPPAHHHNQLLDLRHRRIVHVGRGAPGPGRRGRPRPGRGRWCCEQQGRRR